MNINYEYYRIFYYAAKYKNLTQAAQALHSSQPNVSRTVKLLEDELGCRLFIRSNRGMALTPEGERLYIHVKAAVERIQLAENEIARQTGMEDGCVTIGASETALRMLVLPALRHFKKNHPNIRIRIRNHLSAQAVASAKNKEVDFAVAVTPPPVEKPLVSQSIIHFRDILIGGPSYRVFQGKAMPLKALCAHPLICLPENTRTFQFYENFYLQHGLSFMPELYAATTDQILPMVKNDLGVGYIPKIYAEDALEKGEAFPLTLAEEIPSREICFIENEEYPLNIAARELKSLLFTHQKSPAPIPAETQPRTPPSTRETDFCPDTPGPPPSQAPPPRI